MNKKVVIFLFVILVVISFVIFVVISFTPSNLVRVKFLSGWNKTTSLPTATASAMSVVYNGYVYEIGGYTTAD